jgi:hypothetical protein
MKKFFVMMAALILVTSAVNAEPYFGAKGGAAFGFHGNSEDIENLLDEINSAVADSNISVSIDEKSGIAFELGAYGGYYFTDKLAVQVELDFMIGQSKTWSEDVMGLMSVDILKGKYSSLDIPLLIKFDVVNRPFLFGVLAGPHLSIPLGDIEVTYPGYDYNSGAITEETDEIKSDGIMAGLSAGLYGGLPIGPGRVVADARFLMDFSPLKAKMVSVGGVSPSMETLLRRSINVTLGYEISLGGK